MLSACAQTNPAEETAETLPAPTVSETAETSETLETSSAVLDEVPEMTFDEEINIYIPDGIDHHTPSIVTEEITGDRINDAQYNMKLKMEERFGTTIVQTFAGGMHDNSYITNLIQSDDDTFELCFSLDLYVMNFVIKNHVMSFDYLEHVDFSKVYWDQTLNECISIGEKDYFGFGAYDLSYYDMTHVIAFNKILIDNFSLENPYELVREGKWTFDQFRKMAQTATMEVNGDGRMSSADSFGFISVPKQVPPNFWMAAGEQSIAKDSDNLPFLNLTGNEKFYSIFDWLYQTMWDDGIWCPNTQVGNFWSETVQVFSDDRALFAAQTFYFLSQFRDVESDFGLIPYPKYDEQQESYHSRVEGGCKLAMVPVTNRIPTETGALLEAMASYGYNHIIPEYYEVVLKRKTSRDSESQEMLDLIFSTRFYDFGDTCWCNQLRDGIFAQLFKNNSRNVASEIAAKEKLLNKSIQKTVESYIKD